MQNMDFEFVKINSIDDAGNSVNRYGLNNPSGTIPANEQGYQGKAAVIVNMDDDQQKFIIGTGGYILP